MKVKIEWAAVVAHAVFTQRQKRDWPFFRRLAEITDKHDLTRLLFFFFLQFQKSITLGASADSWLEDPGFVEFINGVVR
jgi:hypothetical protein